MTAFVAHAQPLRGARMQVTPISLSTHHDDRLARRRLLLTIGLCHLRVRIEV